MTTVYIDKRINLVLTDSCVTSIKSRSFLGLFKLRPHYKHKITNQKALYLHDSLFVSTGDVDCINKVINGLAHNTSISYNKNESCICLLLRKDYCIIYNIKNGICKKSVYFISKNFAIALGSGGQYLKHLINSYNVSAEYVIDEFKKVKDLDSYTDDNINLYQF